MRYTDLERIAEKYGIADSDIPAFITDMIHLGQKPVEDWHGKVMRSP